MTSRNDDAEIKARQNTAGRFGFVLGCIAAVVGGGPPPRPLSAASILLAVLLAALNVPLGIALGLLVERTSRRPPEGRK